MGFVVLLVNINMLVKIIYVFDLVVWLVFDFCLIVVCDKFWGMK